MKRLSLIAAMLVLAATFGFAQTFDFKVINDTGYTIDSIYVAPGNDDTWGEDVLAKDVQLKDGESVDIKFDPAYEAELLAKKVEKYDMKVKFEDGSTDEYYDLTLENITELTLSLNKKGEGVATWK